MPAATPDTMPVEPTVAIATSAEVQSPPGAASASIVVAPAHTVAVPVIVPATGSAVTVTSASVRQEPSLYVMRLVPADRPDIMPVEPAVATVVWLLLQVPPGVMLLSVSEEPWQILNVPVRVAGVRLTVIAFTADAVPQTTVTVYEMSTVPAAIPETMPVDPTVARAVLDEVQEPPNAASMSVMSLPSHTADEPVMVPGSGNGFTVTTVLALQPPNV